MKTLFTSLMTATLSLIPAIASAEPSAPVTLNYRKSTIVYTVDQQGDTRVLEGKDMKTGAPFKLYVGTTRVNGVVNGQKVSFLKKSVKPIYGIKTTDQVASR